MSTIRHLHILGAPGSGVSTLGQALAQRLGWAFFDVDDYTWFRDDPLPYRRKRNPDHRRRLLGSDLQGQENWVLAGSLCGWGDMFIPQFDLVAYCWLPEEVRIERIKKRETARYGAARLADGGDLHRVFQKFLVWAAGYDAPSENIRSRDKEEEWLKQLPCPVLRLVEGEDGEKWVDRLFKHIGHIEGT